MTARIKVTREYASNFMSLGNNVNEFIFEEEEGTITWIKGPNGVGKSVIIEILSFAWFARPYRKIKKNIGLRNSSNADSKAPTVAGVEFEKIDGDVVVKYETIRRMTKSGTLSLTILKDGKEMDKAAGMTQKKLEDEILGFDYTIFENIISLNTIQTIPIIDMPPEKKRKLLESIATIHLDKLKKLNKETLKDMQIKFVSATNDVDQYTKDVTELSVILEKLEEERKAGIEDLQNQVNALTKNVSTYEASKKELEIERDKLKERGVNKKAELDKYNGVTAKINIYKAILTHLEYLNFIPAKLEKQREKYDVALKEFKTYTNRSNELGYDKEKHKLVSDELNKVNKLAIDFLMSTKELKNQIDNIIENGKALKAGKPCITCGKPSTEEDVEKIKKDYRARYNVINEEYKEALKKQEANQSRLDEMSAEKERLDKDKEKHADVTAKLNAASNACDREKTEIDNLQGENERKENQIKKLFGENGDSEMLSVDEVNRNITALEAQLEIRAGLETDLNEIRVEATKTIEQIKALRDNIENVNSQITGIKKKIDDKKASNIDDSRSRTAKKLEDTKADLDRGHKRVTKYSDEVAKCKYIEGMYADDGIKQIILQAFVPNLNKAIAHNLSLFELPFSVEFTDSMEYEFTGKFGLAQEYGGLSQGQTRKLNFAITIAFRDFVAAIADFKINILFLDEVLDISTDDEALEHMLRLLKAKVHEVGQIYLMTHRGQNYLEYFDHIVEVEHDGRYGTIKKIR